MTNLFSCSVKQNLPSTLIFQYHTTTFLLEVPLTKGFIHNGIILEFQIRGLIDIWPLDLIFWGNLTDHVYVLLLPEELHDIESPIYGTH
jgi:hypothetical protein